MKGAIGNAFIMNMVITFIIIFYMLLIGSMAYSKAYKSKNMILNLIEKYEENGKFNTINIKKSAKEEWDNEINVSLARIGYPLTTNVDKLCEVKNNNGKLIIGNDVGRYDYCIYRKNQVVSNSNTIVDQRYTYIVKAYMKMDLPIVGRYIRIPITGETKTYYIYE